MTRFGLAFFDVDSTLVTIEGIDLLAEGDAEVARLTEAAMNGEIGVEEVYGRRLERIRPTRSQVETLAARYVESLLPDAREVISQLREHGIDVHLVTAALAQAVAPLAAELGVRPAAVHAVRVEFAPDGSYAGFAPSPLTRSRGKETIVLNVRSRAHGKAAFIGDGVTDLEAKDAVDLFIGFGGVRIRPRVREMADVWVAEPRLAPIVPLLTGEIE
jgi:phosphoserine phosphatase